MKSPSASPPAHCWRSEAPASPLRRSAAPSATTRSTSTSSAHPSQKVAIDAEDGDVTLVRSTDAGAFFLSHMINTPDTSHHVANGVLTLKTRWGIGFVSHARASTASACQPPWPCDGAGGVIRNGRRARRQQPGQRCPADESAPLTVTAR